MRNAFFLGAVAALLALAWFFLIAPNFSRLPPDFSYAADVLSTDDFYDEDLQAFSGPVSSLTKFSYEVSSVEGDDLLVRNRFNVRTPSGDKVFEVERLYAVNAFTGAHVKGKGDHNRDGYLFAPKYLQSGQGFTYWHVNYDSPAQMKFKGEESIDGVSVYRYEASYKADQTPTLSHLPGVPDERGVNLDVRLVLWVEPISGHLVKYEDYSTAHYYDVFTGARLSPWNQFHNEFDRESIQAHALKAAELRDSILLHEVVIPLLLGLVALALLALPYFSSRASDSMESFLETLMGASVVPWIVLLLSLLLAIMAWQAFNAAVEEKALLEFNFKARGMESEILQRMTAYEQVVVGAKAFISASREVTRGDWREFVAVQRLGERLPHFQVIAYSPLVKGEEEKDALIKTVQGEGFPDFSVRPEGARGEYLPLVYLEPFEGENLNAFGYDVFSEEVRRTAVERARDSGATAVTAKVVLVQDFGSERPGVILYSPVYDSGASRDSVEERRSAFKGVASTAFRVNELMKGVSGGVVGFQLFDASQREESLLYDSGVVSLEGSDFTKTTSLNVAGRDWIVVSYSGKGFIESTEAFPPYYILVLGAALSFLLFALFYAYFNNISVRVKSLIRVVDDLSQGRLDAEIDEETLNAKDDVGRLARAFNRMMVSLKLAMRELESKKKPKP